MLNFNHVFDYCLNRSTGVVHLGAHTGEEASLYAKKMKKVIWVEAHPDFYKRLCVSISPYSLQKAYCALLSEKDGEKVLFHVSNNEVSSSLFPIGKDLKKNIEMIDGIYLETARLDTLLLTNDIDINDYNFWIVDLQGAELSALRGAEHLLDKCFALSVECSAVEYYAGGTLWLELRDFLEHKDFISLTPPPKKHGDVIFLNKKYLGEFTKYKNKLERKIESKSLNPAVLNLLDNFNIKNANAFVGQYSLHTLKYLRAKKDSDSNNFQHFISAVCPYAKLSKGQIFQDLWAWWESGLKKNGYFVEFGAADGIKHSNSFFLEKEMGWQGILAEPNPNYWSSLQENRDCLKSNKCVYSVTGEQLEFLAVDLGVLSRIKGIDPGDKLERMGGRRSYENVTVETISLDDLLVEFKAPREIDYLSIDTEGSEYEILSRFDFSRWKIKAISVEHNHTDMRESLYELLTQNGYRRKWEQFSGVDDWYVLDHEK